MVATAVWAAAEPTLGRLLRTPYSDVGLLGRQATRSRWWPAAGVALHLANGAMFGFVFERFGGHGIRRGVLAAEAENLVLWPGMIVVDRIHPERRNGTWPRLLTNRRVIAYEVTTHALFGTVLGLLVR